MPRQTHVLIVDGSPLHTRVLVHLLERGKGSFRIYTAETLTEANEKLREHPIEIALLDLHLPGSREYLLIEQFRREHPDLPLILLANRDNEVLFRQAVRAGISNFLIKGDIEARPLRRSITLALNQHRLVSDLRRENKELHDYAEKMKAVDEIAGFGYFTLDIVSGKMEWSEMMYQLLNQHPGGKPTLSDYLACVHHADRKAVTEFFESALEENRVREIAHRILIDGHRLRRVYLRIRSIPLEVNNRVVLIGSLWQDHLPIRQRPTTSTESSHWKKQSDKQRHSFTEDMPLRLLIAEDHLLTQVALQKTFEKEIPHASIDMVSNGREAVEQIRGGADYDLVLLDLRMPVMDGLEAARQIRMQTNIPLVGLATNNNDPKKRERALKAGFSEILQKPVRKRALRQLLRGIF